MDAFQFLLNRAAKQPRGRSMRRKTGTANQEEPVLRQTRDSIRDVWGERTPFRGERQWPVRVDEFLSEEPERWV